MGRVGKGLEEKVKGLKEELLISVIEVLIWVDMLDFLGKFEKLCMFSW